MQSFTARMPLLMATSAFGLGRRRWQNFLQSRISDKVPGESTLIFVDTQISLKHSIGLVEKKLRAKNLINPFMAFDTTPTYDRQTQTDRHRAIASTHASIESCG